MTDCTINIRAIQHYMYCPRRFGLLEINDDWAENAFVIKANIMHEHVHSGEHRFSSSKKTVFSSITLYNDEPQYDIYGVADCIEFELNENGEEIQGIDGRRTINIVEYKPKQPKGKEFSEIDAIQVYAQKICADFIWKCNSNAYIYYSDVKKRILLPFAERHDYYNNMLVGFLSEMRLILQLRKIPCKQRNQRCAGCSLSDVCFSKTIKYSVRSEIKNEEDDI